MPGKQPRWSCPCCHGCCAERQRSSLRGRDRAMILLSVKAGRRAGESARLDWSMVLGARGKVVDVLAIHDAIVKKRGGRRIPTHPDLRRALVEDKRIFRASHSHRRGAHCGRPAWSTGLRRCSESSASEGCLSHSGRRTFTTGAVRNIHRSGCSLRDVQPVAGRRSIATTERFTDGNTRGSDG
jgi:integrase